MELSENKTLTSQLDLDTSQFTILVIVWFSKTFLTVDFFTKSNVDVTNAGIWHFLKSDLLYFMFKYKFGTKCQLNYTRVVFIKAFNFFPKQERIWSFQVFLNK